MKEKFLRFMQGRYGMDTFSRFMLIVACVLVLLSNFRIFRFFYLLGIALLIYTYYRCFSRNVSRRYAENCKFLSLIGGGKRYWKQEKERAAQRRQYHIYRCPKCSQKIRIPRGRGKIEIDCPICHTKFKKRS